MSVLEADFIVVGGGPAGSLSAETLAARGRTLLFSDVDTRVSHCTGLISKSGLEKIGVTGGDFVLNMVSGANLVAPDGRVVEIDGRQIKALVVDRIALDEYLRNRASDAGAELVEARAGVIENRIVEANGKQYSAGRLVVASGTNYTIHRRLKLDAPERFLVGNQYEMKVLCDEDRVELYFDVPGFFSWVVPAGDYARVGAATEGNPVPYLNSLVARLRKDGRLKSGKILLKSAGMIPVHQPSIKTQYDGLVTVGDAAGQVKATTGGGVVYGGLCGKLSAQEDYERAWKKTLGGELRLHLLIRRMLNRMSARGINRLLSVVDANKSVLEGCGDMDSAKQTVVSLLRNPGFMANIIANSPGLLLDLI